MKAIRLTIVEDPLHVVRPRRTVFVIRHAANGSLDMYESHEGTVMADSEKWMSVGSERQFDLKIQIEECDV